MRFGLRILSKEPLINICVIASLALGIGLNAAVFSFIDALFLKPLPAIQDQGRLVLVSGEDPGNPGSQLISVPNYRDLRDASGTLPHLAASQMIQVGVAAEGTDAEPFLGEMVTGNYFQTLGVAPALGRTFLPEEDRVPGARPVVVLSHSFWRQRFAADPRIVGRQILLNRRPFTVIGVAAEGFKGTNVFTGVSFWVPTMMYQWVFAAPELFELRDGQILQVMGRLGEGVSTSQAAAEMSTIFSRLVQEHPVANRGQRLTVTPLTDALIPANRKPTVVQGATVLMAAVGILLLIACANVANLLLSRAVARRREMSIRMSLGAGRGRLARQLLAESLLLTLIGGAFSLLVAFWVWRLFSLLRPTFLGALDLSMNSRIVAFTALVSVAMGLLCGLAPLLQSTRVNIVSILRDQDPGVAWSSRRFPVGQILVAGQIALCCISLVSAGLFLKSLRDATHIDLGFETARVAMVSFDLRTEGYDEPRGRAFQEQLLARVQQLPGVEAAALGENRLLGGFRMFREVLWQGPAGEEGIQIGSSIVGPEYFATVGIPVLAGRSFDTTDRLDTRKVVIVNQKLAEQLWPGESPLGKRLRLDDEGSTLEVDVVGVVGNTKFQTVGEPMRPFLYFPMAQRYTTRTTLHVRTQGAPEAILGSLRGEVRQLDRQLALSDVESAESSVARSLWLPRLGATLFSLLGLLSLALAAVGVYGVTAYAMSRRTFEVGIRMALGAQRSSILGWGARSGLAVLSVGAVLGWLASLATRGWLSGLAYGEDPLGSLVLPGSLALLLSVGLAANLIPVLRILQNNPVAALRGR